jgi:hypothetical protein
MTLLVEHENDLSGTKGVSTNACEKAVKVKGKNDKILIFMICSVLKLLAKSKYYGHVAASFFSFR